MKLRHGEINLSKSRENENISKKYHMSFARALGSVSWAGLPGGLPPGSAPQPPIVHLGL